MSILLIIIVSLVFIPILIAVYTLILAALTTMRWRLQKEFRTAVYSGRVTHTRLVPVVHSFDYPLFMVAIDLAEVDDLWGNGAHLWPLSIILNFRKKDHYKNNEPSNTCLMKQTFQLVKERTKNKFSPDETHHRVVLVTHLCYYGYCFNPVSIYYILNKARKKTEAIVLEVSNTPWNEMHSYVLHPDSVDVKSASEGNLPSSSRYVFDKTFHVSPFMDMEHTYDWTFGDLVNNKIQVDASMKKGSKMQFTAKVDIERQAPFTPMRLAWQVIQFPIYCAIIQLWIHYEAFWLFYKGVVFQPHPEGSETTASRWIATIMRPFFALKDWWTSGSADAKKEA